MASKLRPQQQSFRRQLSATTPYPRHFATSIPNVSRLHAGVACRWPRLRHDIVDFGKDLVWPTTRPDNSFSHRDVDGVLVLRHAGAPRLLHDKGAAVQPDKVVADLWYLWRIGLFHAHSWRRNLGPLAWSQTRGHHRWRHHGGGPFHDGFSASSLRCSYDDRDWQRLVPAQSPQPDQSALWAGRPPARERLQHLLCRCERRRRVRANRLWDCR